MTLPATEAQALALSPDASSTKAAQKLLNLSGWSDMGHQGAVLWGQCQGSGKTPYQTRADFSQPAAPVFKCTCPSRKFPCKHALALLLLHTQGQVAASADVPAWVQGWLDERQGKAQKAAQKTATAAKPAKVLTPAQQQKQIEKQLAQQQQRQEKRWGLIEAGMHELQLWMQDMIEVGLGQLSADKDSQKRWQTMAARMVDAQAPGMAERVRQGWQSVHAGENWQEKLLWQLGHWQLLVDGVTRRDKLPEAARADLMAALGWTLDKAQVQQNGEALADAWQVLGVARHPQTDGKLTARHVWLRGLHSGRDAWILDYAQGKRGFESAWVSGQCWHGTLHYYPGRAPLRALAGEPSADAAKAPGLQDMGDSAQCLKTLHQQIAANPLQAIHPLWCAKASLHLEEGQWIGLWHEADGVRAVPVKIDEDAAWQLMALTGGHPHALFGEWDGWHWHLLSAWEEKDQQLQMLWSSDAEAFQNS